VNNTILVTIQDLTPFICPDDHCEHMISPERSVPNGKPQSFPRFWCQEPHGKHGF